MCMICELQLFEDHRAFDTEFYDACSKCGKFPASDSGNECYRCFSVGGIVDECQSATARSGAKNFSQRGQK